MSVEKQAIRRVLRAYRKSRSLAFVETSSAVVCARLRTFQPFATAASVVAYLAHENEISVRSLEAEIVQSGRALYLPLAAAGPAVVRWHPGAPLGRGRGGVWEPVAGADEVPPVPAIILIPVVAWDRCGTRLGRGGGFYDRVTARLDGEFTRVGLAYEFQEHPELPRDPWDVSLHYVITERRVVRCGEERPPLLRKGMRL